MKFLPMMFREPQSKWFGKRGLNWHITVGSYLKEGELHSHTIVHIFDTTNQDALTSNSILKDAILRYKTKEDKLTKAYVRSDNAGCFHSFEAIFGIPWLNEQSQLKVVQMDFADPQGGKSICDRRAAHIKAAIRKFVNEGNNVTTASEFLDAVKQSNIKNVEVINATSPKAVVTTKSKVKDITTFNNFQYHTDYVLAFKQYQIGNGVKMLNTTTQVYDGKFPEINVLKSCFTDNYLRASKPSYVDDPTPSAPVASHESNNEADLDSIGSSLLFTCPEPHCLLSFVKFGNLNCHLDKGDHKYSRDHNTLSDRSKVEYIRQMETKKSTMIQTLTNTTVNSSALQRGWALKTKRSVKRFSTDQSVFLQEMFQKGEITGHKYPPEEVSVLMRTIKKDGKRRFTQEEFLTPTQIASYFSRLSLEKRKTAQNNFENEDLIAEQFENNLIDATIIVSDVK